MSASTKAMRKKKSSFKSKLFSCANAKPKLKNLSSGSSPRSSYKYNRRTSSKFGEFIHHTFQKLILSPSTSNLSTDSDTSCDSDIDLKPNKIKRKTHWKPSLEAIYEDKELLAALITFMKRSYNEENILFLQSVHDVNSKINALLQLPHDQASNAKETDIDHQIESIFQLYIASSAEYQVNLSYNCCMNTTKSCRSILGFSLLEKLRIFDESVSEIEHLMIRSVLHLFYQSDEFQLLADIKCPKLLLSPITLSLSQSTLSSDSPAAVVDAESSDSDDFSKDEWIFTDEVYLVNIGR